MTCQIGQVYRHTKTGNLYIVVMIAIDKSVSAKLSSGGTQHVVVYRRYSATGGEGPWYSRPWQEFHETQRFQVDEEGDRFEYLTRFQLETSR